MRPYLKIFLWLVSLFIFEACALRYHSGFVKSESFNAEGFDLVTEHYPKLWFKPEIEAFGKEASGLMIAKRVNATDYRVLFMSHMGMKMFDVEFKKDSFVVHYLISFLDKPSVRKLIESDLSLLLRKPMKEPTSSFIHRKDSVLMLRQKQDARYYYYHYQNERIVQKESDAWWFKGTIIRYRYSGLGLPTQILIDHSGLDLHWKLSPVKKQEESENPEP